MSPRCFIFSLPNGPICFVRLSNLAYISTPKMSNATAGGPAPSGAQPTLSRHREEYRKIFVNLMAAAMGDRIPRVPSPQEIIDIRRETAQHIEHIRSLEALQSMIEPRVDPRLEEALFRARAVYRIYFCRIFRMNELPNEIMTNIFRYVVWSVPDARAGAQWRLWLTWTCRRWRTIALEDPTLWNAIWFRDRPPFPRSFAWFERAASAPLDIRISFEKKWQPTREQTVALLDRVFTKFPNIRMFIFIVESWDLVAIALDKLRDHGSRGIPINIERLELHRTGHPYIQLGNAYTPVPLPEPMALFGGVHAPRLQHVALNGVPILWDTSIFSNLTTLDVRRLPLEMAPTLSRFRDILSSSPALEKLCLDGAGPQLPPYDLPTQRPIPLDNLKILVICDFSVQYAEYVLSHFTAPRLLDLTLVNLVGEDYSPVLRMLTGRFPEVKLLTLYACELVPTTASVLTTHRWLESLPLLTYLRLSSLPPLFLNLFIYDVHAARLPNPEEHLTPEQLRPNQILCPKLSIIEAQPSLLSQLIPWIPKRANLGVPIRKVYAVRDPKEIGDDEPAWLEKCRELSRLTRVSGMLPGTRTDEEIALRST
ncbi:putative F-box-like [Lyophyllum shimeji]|uniref:F-box-like n=1 Tax=Lyophyllum shimeji TaxID=47721 RepID=A0A9P3PH78_LYOSH|nr:putative F-box-like [Lyophyllum shimeji]